jgi:hypothetical protein
MFIIVGIVTLQYRIKGGGGNSIIL